MSIKVIGLTGPTGAGKSIVSKVFESLGVFIIDTDITARKVTEKGSNCLKSLALRFGEDIIKDDGTLDRKLLASRAFADEKGKNDLNSITHPEIKKIIEQTINECKSKNINVLIDAPLLFEANCDTLCDIIIAVTAPKTERMRRILKRDKITKEQAAARINAQKDNKFYYKKADYHIINNGSLNSLILKAEQIAKECLFESN